MERAIERIKTRIGLIIYRKRYLQGYFDAYDKCLEHWHKSETHINVKEAIEEIFKNLGTFEKYYRIGYLSGISAFTNAVRLVNEED